MASPTPTQLKAPRSVPPSTRLQLVALNAGRCAFAGCNRFLFGHPVTKADGNFSEVAHVHAFSPGGPRAGANGHGSHSIENLMLLCAACHKLVDDEPEQYPVELLRQYKVEHERRIHDLTAIGPELRTMVVQLKGTIGGQHVDIPAHDIRLAIAPRYAADRAGHVIDLTGIHRESPDFFRLARDQIRRELRPILRGGLSGPEVRHYSIFALAPIPVLVAFGRELGDKVSADLYQRHRETQSWKWPPNGTPATYAFERIRDGTNPSSVAVLLSLSGRIARGSLPETIDRQFTLYEITLADREPSRDCLRTRDDMDQFRRVYQQALATILRDHDRLTDLHLLPAVPAPIAIACGQELLPKVHPNLAVYDNVKGTFVHAITINTHEDL